MSPATSRVHCTCTPTVRAVYSRAGDESGTEAIVRAVADAADVDPLDLPPLFQAIDPEIIDRVFARSDDFPSERVTLSFEYDRWEVFIRSDGHIVICDPSIQRDVTPIFVE